MFSRIPFVILSAAKDLTVSAYLLWRDPSTPVLRTSAQDDTCRRTSSYLLSALHFRSFRVGKIPVPWVASLLTALLLLAGCSSPKNDPDALFRLLPAERTGITFSNDLTENDTLNVLAFEYVYNGGGVGMGDVNGDSLPDVYLTGNQVPSRLYLGRGDLRFEDVTEQAGVGTDRWATGVAMADVNADGLLDIYVGASGLGDRANLLFVNRGNGPDGVPRFAEEAAAYGLADTGYTTHAAFFDYDQDGDLDLYVLNATNDDVYPNVPRPKRVRGEAPSTDRLYRNNGDDSFTDVSMEAGVTIEGYGLGVAVHDFNLDGWPDVYVANDYLSNDFLYVNNRDGTFTNRIADYLKHQSNFAMGADAADVSGDGLADLVVLDMKPPGKLRQKQMSGAMSYDGYRLALSRGYEPQFMRNTLQLHYGLAPDGQPRFGDVGQLAGIHETDWSWAPLLADFDNDGRRDLFVTNGYRKDLTDRDFVSYRQASATGRTQADFARAMLPAIRELPGAKTANFIFQNQGDLAFADRTSAWGLSRPTYSNGAAFADLDLDGDLDLVINNLDEEAHVYENRANELTGQPRHFLRVRLEGPAQNRAGLGADVRLYHGGHQQAHRHAVQRGYQSTVEETVHFGLGEDARVDSLVVMWPDGRGQRLTDVRADQTLTLAYTDAVSGTPRPASSNEPALFENVTVRSGLDHRHQENAFIDFNYEPLLPHLYSRNGPPLTVGDVDGDGLEDAFVGGASQQAGHFFLQGRDGRFQKRPLEYDVKKEDLGALFFDADGDGDLDLYVASGGSEFPPRSRFYQDRLYVGDGRGGFTPDSLAFPSMPTSGGAIAAGDYDGDGDLDLFVGGRVVPGQWPYPPRSYLLENRSALGGPPRFADVTAEAHPGWRDAGMVTDALWTDFDEDGRPDLVVAGEWMPVRFYRNAGGRFEDVTEETGLAHTSGWWQSLAAGDFDGDGDEDLLAGNLGLNATLKASPEEPVRVVAGDFDRNGSLDAVTFHYIDGEEAPLHARDDLLRQLAPLRKRFPNYRTFAEATSDDVLTPEEQTSAYTLQAELFESSFFENLGGGHFARRALPTEAQFAPLQDMTTGDFDGDGDLDALLVGNFYPTEVVMGRYDAFVGLFLKGNGAGAFMPVQGTTSGFLVEGDARAVERLRTSDGLRVVVTQNDDEVLLFKIRSGDGLAGGVLEGGGSRRTTYEAGATSEASR